MGIILLTWIGLWMWMSVLAVKKQDWVGLAFCIVICFLVLAIPFVAILLGD